MCEHSGAGGNEDERGMAITLFSLLPWRMEARRRVMPSLLSYWNYVVCLRHFHFVLRCVKLSSIRSISKRKEIPYTVLQGRIKTGIATPPSLVRKVTFTPDDESEIAGYEKKLANMFFGSNPVDSRRVVFEFLRWNSSLSLRKPKGTSIGRIKGFNREESSKFVNNIEEAMSKYKFFPSRVYNMDETGMGTGKELDNIIATKGQKRIGPITSWERGENITVIRSLNAAGSFVPSLFVFLRKRMSPTLEKDGSPGAMYTCSNNEQSVLLILDNHYSLVTLEACDFSKLHGSVMVSIPPHSSHRLRPLDGMFFERLKKTYCRECDIFMKVNTQGIIRPDDFAALFNRAFLHVATIANGVSGFKATGIMPLGANIFTKKDFAFEIETGNLTTVLQASSSQQVETNIEKATVSTPPTSDTADSMANICTSIQNSPTVSFESISPLTAKAKSVNTVVKCRRK
ncbi:hypothetical protein PR048_003952 [Dryococelus australis]|uniref:DDE-1 domain-containing protein n=1 Tax=Dryococelus australis TaxID=614101 RepID=A0ABQ9I438_9NEOP|nr:hypothetical protein PR048_003952 [Dryococelus australis]